MADENVIGLTADASQLIKALGEAQKALSDTATKMKGDANVISAALNTVTSSGGGLQKLIDILSQRAGARNSGYLSAVAEELRSIQSQASQTVSALERVRSTTDAMRAKTTLTPAIRGNQGVPSGQSLLTIGGSLNDQKAAITRQQTADGQRYEATLRAARLAELRAQADERATKLAQEEEAARAVSLEYQKRAIAAGYSGGNGAGGGGRSPYGGNQGDGFGGNLRQGFIGAHGETGTSALGFTLGQAARFGVLYGSMYRVLDETLTLFKEAFDSAVSYQKSVAELQFQTGQSASAAGQLANLLQSSATQYGESGSVGIEAGQKALGLYGATTASPDIQDATAIAGAQVASKLAYVTGKPVDQLVEGLGALTKAFGQGAESINAAADIVVKFGQIYHVNAADLAAAAPKLAPLAETLGFSQKEAIALEAATSARTGQNPSQAVSGIDTFLAKGLSGPLLSVLSSLGITNGSVKEQVTQLAKIFTAPDTSQATREQILGAAGRGGTNRDIVTTILEVLGQVNPKTGQDFLSEANGTKTAGSLDSFVAQIQATLGGELRKLAGSFNQLAVDFAQSGVFDTLGLFVIGLRKTVDAVDGVLKVFNKIEQLLVGPFPDAVQTAIKALVSIVAVGAVANIASGGRVGLAAGALVGRVSSGVIEGQAAGGLVGGLKGGASGVASALGGTTGAIIATTIGLGLFEKGIFDWKDKQEKANSSLALLSDQVGKLSNGDALTGVTNSLQEYINTTRGNRGPLGIHGGSADATANIYQNALDQINALTKPTTTTSATDTSAVFGDFTPEKLSAGLSSLQANGYSAQAALQKLNDALADTGQRSQSASANLSTLARDVIAGFTAVQTNAKIDNYRTIADGSKRNFPEIISSQQTVQDLTNADFFGSLQGYASKNGVTDSSNFSANQQTDFANQFAKTVATNRYANDPIKEGEYEKYLEPFIEDLLNKTVNGYVKAVNGQSAAEAFANVQSNLSTASSAKFLPGDYASQTAALRLGISTAQGQINSAGANQDVDSLQGSFDAIAQAKAQLGLAEVQQLKDLLTSSTKGTTDLKTALANGQQIGNALLSQAVADNDTTDITSIVAKGGEKAAEYAKAQINAVYDYEIQLAKDQFGNDPAKYAAAVQSLDLTRSAELQAVTSGLAQSASKAQVDAAKFAAGARQGDAVASAAVALKKAQADQLDVANNPLSSPIDLLNAQTAVNSALYNQAQATIQAHEQVNTTAAAKTGGAVASTNAALKNAELEITAAGKDAVLRQIALQKLYDAQQAAATAALAAIDVKRQLGIDLTNPVATAADALQTAQDKYNSDKKLGLGSDTLNQDKLGITQSSNTLQKAKFDQYNQDLQTAKDLGQISSASYLQSVNAEISDLTQKRSLLKKTDNMYRQYTDEINSLAETKKNLQDALSSQFNLGSIQVPTVYDARRYAQGFGGPSLSAPGGNTTQITIYANTSADIEQALSNVFGTGSGFANVVY